MIGELFDTLRFAGGYNAAVVTLGCAAFGLAAGSIGCFVLLRGRALIADAAAHATLPGVCGAFILAVMLGWAPRSLPLLLTGAAVTAAIGVLVANGIARAGRLRDDTAMALVISIGFGIGITLITVVQSLPAGGQAGLSSFIFGQAAGMSAADAWLIGGLAMLALLLVAVLFKPLTALCFDDGFAASVGLPVRALDLALMGLMLAVTVAGLRAVGLILVVALMIVPAATARLATERLEVMVPLAGALGAIAAWFGAGLSAAAPRLPTGATITLVACALFMLFLIFAPSRGAVAYAWRRARLSLVIARDHALQTVFEAQERRGSPVTLAWSELGRGAGWSAWQRAALPIWLRRAGYLVEAGGGTAALTPAGAAVAREVITRHRLWENYLEAAAAVPHGAAHLSADAVEHTLPAEVARDAEAWLRAHDPTRLKAIPPQNGAPAR